MRFKNSGTAKRILGTPGELFAAAQGENAIFPVLIWTQIFQTPIRNY